MASPLIEAIAQAMEPLVSEDMAEPFKSAWLADLAQTAVTTLEAAGYVIVPSEPTGEMRRAYNDAVAAGGMRHLLPTTAWEILLNFGRVK